ncbi:MAG: DUF1836 domain-containing protein [Lachnospiraceae bacterium]|nr:DUF1836 domain-containing protein [Lachnospiraceae bacterium]
MTLDSENLLESLMESLDRIEYIKPEDIPNIDLYMDQVTTFMDEKLKASVRNPGDDKILTKTMINNYAKNDLLPPPVKKKYSKEHVLLLIFIYYYKGVLSINDIQTLLSPITEKYFQSEGEFSLKDIYNEVFSAEKELVDVLKADVSNKYNLAGQTFEAAPDEDKDFLKLFSFICFLSVDVYVKRMIIEKLIDELGEKEKSKDLKEAKKTDKKNEKNP